MSVLANVSNLSSGMGLGFPAITFQSLTNQTDPMALTNDQASWFGEYNSPTKGFVKINCQIVFDVSTEVIL